MENSRNMKITPAGLFPDDWEIIQLGTKASVLRGGSPRPIDSFLTNDPDGINWIKIGDVSVGAKYIKQTEEKIIPEGAARSRKVYAGDFLLSNSMSFGRPYILQIDGCIHDGWLVIQEYYDTFETDYLYYALNSGYVLEQYKSLAAGSSVLNLNKDIVKRVNVAVPSRSEQKRIAEALSGIDNMIATLDEAIEKKRHIKEGLMQNLLTGRARLQGFSGEWQEYVFSQLFSPISDKGSNLDTSEYRNSGKYPIIDQGQGQIAGFTNRTNPIVPRNGGYIIFGDHTRVFKYIDTPFFTGADGTRILKVNPLHHAKFLYYICSILEIPNTGYNRHYKYLTEMQFRLPKTIEEECAIAEILISVDDNIQSLKSQSEKYLLIKQGMMQELLTGKTRLI